MHNVLNQLSVELQLFHNSINIDMLLLYQLQSLKEINFPGLPFNAKSENKAEVWYLHWQNIKLQM